MRTIHKLKEILNETAAETSLEEAIYTWPQQFNVKAGKCKTPVAVMMLPTKWRLDIDGPTAREDVEVNLYFLDVQRQLDFDADENELIIDRMLAIAIEFLGKLRSFNELEVVSELVEGASVYDATDRNLTGCRLTVRVKEKQGVCMQPLAPRCN